MRTYYKKLLMQILSSNLIKIVSKAVNKVFFSWKFDENPSSVLQMYDITKRAKSWHFFLFQNALSFHHRDCSADLCQHDNETAATAADLQIQTSQGRYSLHFGASKGQQSYQLLSNLLI